MASQVFSFRQFIIRQDQCAMKVGTDGMLLGAWINAVGANQVLDIGTGTGLLALMIAQRSQAEIDAIEVDEQAFLQAKENAAQSPWHERIKIILSPLQEYSKTCRKKYDLIISNPPFFAAPNTAKGNNKQFTFSAARASARFSASLSRVEILEGVNTLLAPGGKFIIILPAQEGMDFMASAEKEGFYCNTSVSIKSREDQPVIRYILTLEKEEKQLIKEEIIIYERSGKYTRQYITLTREYHNKDFT